MTDHTAIERMRTLVESVQSVLLWRVGELPDKGYIRDNDPSRTAIREMANALADARDALNEGLRIARVCNGHEGEVSELLREICAAQNVGPPYRGWNLTKLNAAVEKARTLLGLPSAMGEEWTEERKAIVRQTLRDLVKPEAPPTVPAKGDSHGE